MTRDDEKKDVKRNIKDEPSECEKGFDVIEGGMSLDTEEDLEKYLKEMKEGRPKTLPTAGNVETLKPPERKQTAYELEMSKFLRVAQECNARYEVLALEGYPPDIPIIRDKQTGLVTDQIYGVRSHVMKVLNDPIIKSPSTIGLIRVYGIKEKEATDFIKMWLSTRTGEQKKVSNFIGLGKPDRYCHSFDFVPMGRETPHWNEILDRCDNAEALIAYIASIFEWNSPRGQYVWLHGAGGDSKSVLSDALCQVLGSAAVQINSVDSINRFFVGSNWLRRLIVCQEALPEVARNQRFKSMVSDPLQEHELKYQVQRQIKVHFKFILNSNHAPEVDDLESDKRRIIYCPIKPFTGKAKSHSEIVSALVDEFADFLQYAFSIYDRVANGKMIKNNQRFINQVIDENFSEFDYLMKACFYFVMYDDLPKDLKKGARLTEQEISKIVRAKLKEEPALLRTWDGKEFKNYLQREAKNNRLFGTVREKYRRSLYKGLIKRTGELPRVYSDFVKDHSH